MTHSVIEKFSAEIILHVNRVANTTVQEVHLFSEVLALLKIVPTFTILVNCLKLFLKLVS